MKTTTNFGLKKPEENEFYDVNVQNDNMDAVDKVLQEFNDGTQPVGDSAKLGGETAETWQGKIDKIETVKSATFPKAGWYRIAQRAYASVTVITTVDINVVARLHQTCNFKMTRQGLELLDSSSSTHVISKARYVTANGYAYIDIYTQYDGELNYRWLVSDSCSLGSNLTSAYNWSAIEPIAVEDVVDGETVGSVIDIAKNAKSATSVDLANYLMLTDGSLLDSLVIKTDNNSNRARSCSFKNADDTLFGGVGAFSQNGVIKHLYLGVGYSKTESLTVTADDIKWKNNDILHTGNKPSGSYVGNGDATGRTIDVGGVGDALLVWREDGVSTSVLVTHVGWFGGKAGSSCEHETTARLSAYNNFNLWTTHEALNANGVTYKYRLL